MTSPLERLGDALEPPLTTPDEAGLWAFLRELAWPDPSPELEGLTERVEAGAALLWRGRPLERVLAIWDAYRALTQRFTAARRAWSAEGRAPATPPGTYPHQLGPYALVRGEETYARVLASPQAASALAAEPGFVAHGAALAGLEDVFRRALEDVDERALERLAGGGAEPEREARWAAWQAMSATCTALDEARFWELVAEMDFAGARDDEEQDARGAAALAALGASGVVAFSARRHALARRLEERLTRWEEETGERIEAGDDSFRDLVNHLIGSGREAYQRALAEPATAALLARDGAYRESFAYVEQWAWEAIPLEVLCAQRT